MRCMARNMIPFYYATYQGKVPVVVDGVETGEYVPQYSDPVYARANIAPASGATVTEIFGTTEGYDRVLVLDDPEIPINEYSVLWIEQSTTEDYNYVVRRIARSLNSVSIAVNKVDVDAG